MSGFFKDNVKYDVPQGPGFFFKPSSLQVGQSVKIRIVGSLYESWSFYTNEADGKKRVNHVPYRDAQDNELPVPKLPANAAKKMGGSSELESPKQTWNFALINRDHGVLQVAAITQATIKNGIVSAHGILSGAGCDQPSDYDITITRKSKTEYGVSTPKGSVYGLSAQDQAIVSAYDIDPSRVLQPEGKIAIKRDAQPQQQSYFNPNSAPAPAPAAPPVTPPAPVAAPTKPFGELLAEAPQGTIVNTLVGGLTPLNQGDTAGIDTWKNWAVQSTSFFDNEAATYGKASGADLIADIFAAYFPPAAPDAPPVVPPAPAMPVATPSAPVASPVPEAAGGVQDYDEIPFDASGSGAL